MLNSPAMARSPTAPRAASSRASAPRRPRNGAGHTQALSRGIAVLDAIAATEHGASLSSLAGALALPVPTVHRLLATLAHAGYVESDAQGAWRIGVGTYRAGSAFLAHRNLLARALPALDALMRASGETANLAVIEQGEAVFVAQSPCAELMRMSARLGARVPLHASGVGKAMLAQMTGEEVREALRGAALARFTPQTITSRERLVAELAATRARGYAIDGEEHAPGLTCVASAILDERGRAWAALSLAGPTSRLPAARVAALGAMVRDAARTVTRTLGGIAPDAA